MRLGMDRLAGRRILVFGLWEFDPGLEEPLRMAFSLLQDPLQMALLERMKEWPDPAQARKLELPGKRISFPSSQ